MPRRGPFCPWSAKESQSFIQVIVPGGEGDILYNGLYGEAPPERGTFIRLQVFERVEILLVEVYKREGKSVILVCERAQKGYQMNFLAL